MAIIELANHINLDISNLWPLHVAVCEINSFIKLKCFNRMANNFEIAIWYNLINCKSVF